MSKHTTPPVRAEDVVLRRGEKLVTFARFTYEPERQILLLFGVLLAGCGVGLVLLYFWVTILRRAPRAIAITSSRLRYWKGDQAPVEHVLSDLARVAPLRAAEAGTDWIALLASGLRGARHTEDPVWKLARGLVITTDRLDTSSITLPFNDAETIGPLVAARIAGRPRGDGRNGNEDALLREPRTPDQMREPRGPHGATLLHLAVREDTVRPPRDRGATALARGSQGVARGCPRVRQRGGRGDRRLGIRTLARARSRARLGNRFVSRAVIARQSARQCSVTPALEASCTLVPASSSATQRTRWPRA